MLIAGLAAPVMIAMLLLLAGSPSVTANDQPSQANAEVKIDNFDLGRRRSRYPSERRSRGQTKMTFPIPRSAQMVCSSPRCWIRMKNSPTRLTRRERIPTTARSTRR